MINFIKRIFDKLSCMHEYEMIQEAHYSDSPDRYLYLCRKYGKFKKIRL